jgi:hypothetical protein
VFSLDLMQRMPGPVDRDRQLGLVVPTLILLIAIITPDSALADSADGATDLAAQSNNPGAPLVQLTFQNTYSPANHRGRGYSNEFQFQPVIPLEPFGPFPWPSISRPSVPIETSAGPGRETGLGDIELLHIFVPHSKGGFSWGLGAEFTFPTAGHSVNGDEKWVAGPAAFALVKLGDRLQIGAIARERISFAGKGSRDDIHELAVQPICQYNLDDGWYVSMGDFDWKFDWKDSGAATIPAALQVGKVADIGGKLFNLSLEYGYYVARHGPNPNYSIRLGFSRLLPKK